MKIPRERRTYCPKCKKHTVHEVHTSKRRKAIKKLDLRYKCKECGKAHIKGTGFRAGKVEFVSN